MKYMRFYLCIIFILSMVTSCDRTDCLDKKSTQSYIPSENISSAPSISTTDKIIAEGDHFQLVSHGLKKTTYYIFDVHGNIVAKKHNDQMSVTVNEQNGVVIVREGLGNGPPATMYYCVEKDKFSSVYYDVVAYEDEIVIYPQPDGSGIVIESVFDSSIYKTIDCRLDMSFRKAIQKAYFEDGSAVVEYKCFIDENSDKTVVKKEIVPLHSSVK